MWLKPVATLSRDLVIRRIDTTTLIYSTALFWLTCQTSIIAEQDAVVFFM